MPRIFDNINQRLKRALVETLEVSEHADFCVGYFNLRGWRSLDKYVEKWEGGGGHCCRLLVGMQRLPQEELRSEKSLSGKHLELDNQTMLKLKKKLAEEFREQLILGAPTNEDEKGLQKLARQIKGKKVQVKLFLKHPLHAKLYLLFRSDPINPIVGYLGSSNLTHPGLSLQGELNIDVMDHDACQKLSQWFEDRWNDKKCIDISEEIVQIIEESWAREKLIPPHHIYVKIAYHLSQEARAGLTEYRIPKDFNDKLLDFQVAAVKIAAHHLNKRGGVLIGDVVGLGKTLMATALARIFEDDHGHRTLIICPKNLVPMWKDYREQYGLRARVLSISSVVKQLPNTRRYHLVLIDESHNLRNREGKRYRALREYIRENASKCILLSATPYNKTYMDLSSQLRLFVSENEDLGIRPERLLRDMSETEFLRKHQAPVRSLAAFENSEYADDWRELMRLYLVRRTRSFIQDNYAETDEIDGRKYLKFNNGRHSYFPKRIPKTIKFDINAQYAQLFADNVIHAINSLELPRYDLGNYVTTARISPTPNETKILNDLSRAGKRLMGFCRTNLFKRLESSGHVFLLSLEHHILRNFIFLYAIENDLPFPIGATDSGTLDAQSFDEDADQVAGDIFNTDDDYEENEEYEYPPLLRTEDDFREQASIVYEHYSSKYKKRFRWLASHHFDKQLQKVLLNDAEILRRLLVQFGEWQAEGDVKLQALSHLLTHVHPNNKVLIFTQFADTVRYLENELKASGVQRIEAVTGSTFDPTRMAHQFSPISNEKRESISADEEIRVLVATDVLSEGQNLQDCAIVVNYDLPWAIIRLIQRAGRVDRIGQQAHNILCYSFLPADGIEQLIRLRSRVRHRLSENAEVVGTDEAFFEDEDEQAVLDLYNEKAGILDGDDESEVDLASHAYQIWKNAIDADPSLEKIIKNMPSVVYSSKAYESKPERPDGALVYMQTSQEHDALAWVDHKGNSVTESQFEILRTAECLPDTQALPRHDNHHKLVGIASEHIVQEGIQTGGQLGRPSGARFRTYERLKNYVESIQDTLFDTKALRQAIDDIYQHPLRQTAVDLLNRQLRSGITNEALAELVVALREDDRLCVVHEKDTQHEPRIICSMGLIG